ncbi:MAG: large repetitive protein [Chloroflexota bacterium]|jgi:N-acetylneuraminic acid mutarotase|nr:large repetitive protein [Chloroflexota bacterium]
MTVSSRMRVRTQLRRWQPSQVAVTLGMLALLGGAFPVSAVRASSAAPTFTTLAPLPFLRTTDAAAGPDGNIYTIAGQHGGTPLWQVLEYDPAANTWTQRSNYPDTKSAMGVVTGHDGLIYSMGGIGWGTTSAMYAYNTVADTWTERAPLPTARFGLAAAVAPDGRIFAIGGSVLTGTKSIQKASAEVDAYTPHTNTWKKVGSLPKAFATPSATTGADGRIYVVEGCTSKGCLSRSGAPAKGPLTPQLLAYDPTTNRWATLAPPPLPRSFPSVIAGADGRIWVIGAGGYASTDNSAEVYTPAINRWTLVPSLATPISAPALARGTDGRVYGIGGIDMAKGEEVTTVTSFPS